MANKKDYPVGTWIGVPLKTSGFALGLITRVGAGGILFGYFFGPKIIELPKSIPEKLNPEDKIFWGQFSHLGLVKDRWHIIGIAENFCLKEWPLPPMIRVDDNTGVAFLSYYSDKIKLQAEERCDPELLNNFPYDALDGAGAIETQLTKLLEGS